MPRVGLAYSAAFLGHDTGPFHPERPARLEAITTALRASGTWDRLAVWEPAPADGATLELVHTRSHVVAMRELIRAGGGAIDPDTLVSPGSWEAAVRGVGACVEAVERVGDGLLEAALCLPRPPGHHATPHQAMGFCLFNNVAIAAAWLIQTGRAARVAILDYDVHHGNGTQDAFYRRADVLYVSAHQYPLYPGTGHWRETGVGPGVGYTVNVAVPPGAGDAIYGAALEQVVEPVVRRYQPEFVLVSLGFDAFWGDPLAQLRLSIGGAYVPLLASARRLAQELCGGRLMVALEGGYNLEALAHGGVAIAQVLLGEEPDPDPLGTAPDALALAAAEPLLRTLRQLHHLA